MISRGLPEIGVTDPNEQFLLTLVEELVHPKVDVYAQVRHTRWKRLIHLISPRKMELPLIYRQGTDVQREWRKDLHEWITKAIAARLVGKSELLTNMAREVAEELWEKVK